MPLRCATQDRNLTACVTHWRKKVSIGLGLASHRNLESRVRDFPTGTVDKNSPASAGVMGSISGPGRFHTLRKSKPSHHNYWAHTLEPANCNYWACMRWPLKPVCLEPGLCSKRSRCNENSTQCSKEQPQTATTRESQAKAMKTQCSQKEINKITI